MTFLNKNKNSTRIVNATSWHSQEARAKCGEKNVEKFLAFLKDSFIQMVLS